MNVVPLVKKRDWHYFDQQLAELNSRDVETAIARGRVLIEMKEELEHGSFEATVKRHMSTTAAQRLMKIAGHPVISKAAHGPLLPASWRTLYELTKLPDETIIAKLKDGTINPKTERSDVIAIQDQGNPRRDKLVAAIKADPSANQRDAAKANGVSLGVYQRTLWKLKADGEIKTDRKSETKKTQPTKEPQSKAHPTTKEVQAKEAQSTATETVTDVQQARRYYLNCVYALPENEQIEELRVFFRRELKWTHKEMTKFLGVIQFKL